MHDAVATVKALSLIFMACGAGQSPGGRPLPPVAITRAAGDGHSWKESERGGYSGVTADWHDRPGARRRTVQIGDAANSRRLTRVYASEGAARRAAEAESRRLARAQAEFSITLAAGRPDLFPEKTVAVSGFKPRIDATDWLITECRHAIDGRGLTTSLQMERAPGVGGARP